VYVDPADGPVGVHDDRCGHGKGPGPVGVGFGQIQSQLGLRGNDVRCRLGQDAEA
jgi:hypothetical protein